MRLAAWLLICGIACAQQPNFSGVWKADPGKSKGLPTGTTYLLLVDQKADRFTEISGLSGPRGEQRSIARWDLSGKEARGVFEGLPIKSTAVWLEGMLVVDAQQPNRAIKAKYSLSADGNTLTSEWVMSSNGRELSRTLVMDKQPDSAADSLRRPEQLAGERFKNLQLFKDVPASALLDTMRNFAFALGKNCQFCHVQADFASEEKKEKATARKMIQMVRGLNQNSFDGKNAVRCFNCHQGHQHPPDPVF